MADNLLKIWAPGLVVFPVWSIVLVSELVLWTFGVVVLRLVTLLLGVVIAKIVIVRVLRLVLISTAGSIRFFMVFVAVVVLAVVVTILVVVFVVTLFMV